jgi:hypothetical protein
MTGPLQVKVWFDFPNAVFEGEAFDELWYWSGIYHLQYADARVRVTELQDLNHYDDAVQRIDDVIHLSGWGENHKWSKSVASPTQGRRYDFETVATFQPGSPVLLETGVRHVTRVELDDEAVVTHANIDLKLTRIEVRSCQDIFA